VVQILKAKSPYIAIHEMRELELMGAPSKLLFNEDSPDKA
jgi:hypothetical protein